MTYDADAASGTVGLEPDSAAGQIGRADHIAHHHLRAPASHHQFDVPGQHDSRHDESGRHEAVHHDNGAAPLHLDAAGADVVQVPDPALLFNGHYRHAGPDLVISGDGGREILITDYFTGSRSLALTAPNGARLSGELVVLLAGSPTPDHYAQTAPAAPSDSIGRAEKITGTVTVIRNGVAVALNSGDPVYKSDVIQTGADSSAGISFPDGTALNLVANTRMALNDYSFDPNGTSNVALISLVQGTFAFVAGQVAHTGDMKIETPVATMGIRGTTGTVQEVATISANLGGVTYSFTVTEDYGTGRVGQYELVDQSGNVIATVSQNGYITYISPQGPNLPPLVSTQPMNNSQVAFEQQIIQQVFQTLLQGNPGLNQSPVLNQQNSPSSPGSSTPPDQLHNLPQLLQNGTGPINIAVTGPNGTQSGTVTVTPTSGSQNQTAGPADLVVSTGTTTIGINETVNNLTIAAGAVLDIVSPGSLTVIGSIDNAGTIKVTTTAGDPLLQGPIPVTNLSGALIEATGVDSSQTFQNNSFDNAGTVTAIHGGIVTFQYETITNTHTIEASDGGVINIENSTVTGTGSIAVDGATEITSAASIDIVSSTVDGGTININGTLDATGSSFITDAAITVGTGGMLEATGGTLTIGGGCLTVDNDGTVEATNGGALSIATGQAIANNGSLIADGGTLVIGDAVVGTGIAIIEDGGTLEFNSSVSSQQTVEFGAVPTTGANVLEVSDAADFQASITGLALGDTIDLTNIAPSSIESATISGSTLTVDESGETTLTFNIAGALSGTQFSIVSDQHGGTDLVLTQQAGTNLVVNGGFETGNLDGWTAGGDLSQPQYDGVTTVNPNSGSYDLRIGAIGDEYGVSQTITTVAGETYQIQFWLENGGGTPSNFTASFGDVTLLSLTNSAWQAYTEYTYDVTATSTSTTLEFQALQDPSFWYLDDVSVVALGIDPMVIPGTSNVVGAISPSPMPLPPTCFRRVSRHKAPTTSARSHLAR